MVLTGKKVYYSKVVIFEFIDKLKSWFIATGCPFEINCLVVLMKTFQSGA